MAPQVLATIRAVVPLQQQTKVLSLYGCVCGLSSSGVQLGGGHPLEHLQWFGNRPFALGFVLVPKCAAQWVEKSGGRNRFQKKSPQLGNFLNKRDFKCAAFTGNRVVHR